MTKTPNATQTRLRDIDFIGHGLKRPECVLCTADGSTHVANWDGGISRIYPDGRVEHLLANPDTAPLAVQPNGICLLADTSYLLAHLGASTGGVYRLDKDGQLTPFLTEVNGQPLPPSNYIHLDAKGRLWITVSTRLIPRAQGYKASVADGFIILLHEGKARIVADQLGYTNECVVDPAGEYLYVNETFGRRMSRFRIGADHTLGARETVTHFGAGSWPDGLVFDVNGDLWVTSIISNRIIKVTPQGEQHIYLQDVELGRLSEIEAAYLSENLGRAHLDNVHSKRLQNISSLAFGGADLQLGYLGCLLGDKIATLRMPVAGHAPVHWWF